MRPPFCSVDFDTIGASPDPVSARIIRRGFAHEICIFRFKDRRVSSRVYRTDMPVRATWGVYPRFREEFVGYVHHVEVDVETVTEQDRTPTLSAVCVGATRVFRNEVPRSWGRTRSDLVAGQLAAEGRLSVDADPSDVVHDALLQPAISGWSFLAQLARAEGMFLSATKTRINFWDLGRRLWDLVDYAPVFDHNSGDVARFQPVSGELNPSDREARERVLIGLDTRDTEGRFSGRMTGFSTMSDPQLQSLSAAVRPTARYTQFMTSVAGDTWSARTSVEAAERAGDRVYQAKAQLAPFPPLRPGDPLVLTNYGARQSGVWVVDDVEFNLTTEKITSQVSLSRALAEDDGFRPRFPAAKAPSRRPVRSALVNGVWVDRGAA